MRIRDEIRLGVGVLLAIQVLAMVAAVALLARMTPAMDRILEDNEKSIRAVEQMLLALAERPVEPGQSAARRVEFERALAEAAGNITEPSEAPVLDRIAEQHEAALAGDPAALDAVRTDLWLLGDINRQSMLAANASAKRLGTAGAWVLVFLGLIGLVLSIMVMRRARTKLINPVYELGAVLEACGSGDRHRRFNPAGASREFQDVAKVVNSLVAEHFAERESGWDPAAELDRVALLRLLDRQPDATLVCTPTGQVGAANEAALDLLAGPMGAAARDAIARVCAGDAVVGVEVEPLAQVGLLCRLRPDQLGRSSLAAGVGASLSGSGSFSRPDSLAGAAGGASAGDDAGNPPLASS